MLREIPTSRKGREKWGTRAVDNILMGMGSR
jgi:hypothetical protein